MDNPDPVVAGEELSYAIVVTNNGPSDATNVIVTDTLPAALISPFLTPTQGSCTVFPCNLGTITNGHSASITVTSAIDSGASGTISNTASVTNDIDDSNLSNNTATQSTLISASPTPTPTSTATPTPTPSTTPTPTPTLTPTPTPTPTSTISPSFTPAPTGEIGVRPAMVTFIGRAFPNAKIFIVDKDSRFDVPVSQNIITDVNGNFMATFSSISQGLHSFALLIKDRDGRVTQTKFFNIDIVTNDFVIKDILVPPTIGFVQRLVSRGQSVIIIGSASPGNTVVVEIDDTIKKETIVDKDGLYKITINTATLEFAIHNVRVKQVDSAQNRESDYSPINTFTVSRLVIPKADLSGDGVVNIRDWSIFLANWGSKDESRRKTIDFNGDGKVNILDFSIFIRAIKK